MTLKLAELIDLETQLLRDEHAFAAREGKALQQRDRDIGRGITAALDIDTAKISHRLATDVGTRRLVCREWLNRLPKATQDALPGARVERGYHLIGWVLLILLAVIGAGTAHTVLGDGNPPVNVLVYIVVFFVTQIALLVFFPVVLLLRRSFGRSDFLPWFQDKIVRLSRTRVVDKLLGKHTADLPDTLSALHGRQTIYGGLQQWILFVLLQRTATAFNLAALFASFYVVTFYDLAFCWSTTLDVLPADLHRWLGWIAAPWSWLGDYATPTVTTVELSRWVPTEGGYLPIPEHLKDADPVKLRRTWWPFLVAGLIIWGLLPRALAWTFGNWRARRERRAASLDHMAFQHLYERLFHNTAWSGPSPDSVRGKAPVVPDSTPRPPRPAPAGPCHLIAWGSLAHRIGALQDHLSRHLSRPIDAAHAAGTTDLQTDRQSIEALANSKATRIVLVLPEGHQPTKEVMRFLSQLRERMGGRCELLVGLLAETNGSFMNVGEDELAPWRSQLLAQADPYLTIEVLA